MKSETIGDDPWARVPDDVREELRRLIADDIARAEQRHPSAVLVDIVGPARGASVGVACRGEEDRASILARARCRVKMSLAHSQAERAEQEAKRAEWEALLGYDETADDSAARGAGEESE